MARLHKGEAFGALFVYWVFFGERYPSSRVKRQILPNGEWAGIGDSRQIPILHPNLRR